VAAAAAAVQRWLEAVAYRGERARELLRGGNPRISAGNAGQWAGLGPPGFAKDFLVFAVAGGAEATLVQVACFVRSPRILQIR
jgi:hypothetical protein